MKLSQRQLRSLIEGVVKQRLSEVEAPPKYSAEENFPVVEHVTEAFREALDGDFPFDAGDPSMAATGPEAWEAQKDRAVEKFQNDVTQVVDVCINALIGGEFHY